MWVVGTYVKLSTRISIHLIGTGNEEVNQGVKIVGDVLVDTLYMDRYEECQRVGPHLANLGRPKGVLNLTLSQFDFKFIDNAPQDMSWQ